MTHAGGWTVQHVSLLQTPILHTGHGILYAYKLLQHGSTAFGAALLLYGYARWFRQTAPHPAPPPATLPEPARRRLLLTLAALALVVAGLYSLYAAPPFSGLHRLPPFARSLAVTGLLGLCIELMAFSSLRHLRLFPRKPAGISTADRDPEMKT